MIPNTPDQHPDNLSLMQWLPTELWQSIFRHVDTSPKNLTLVCRQFLEAWRAGVLGVYVHVPSAHALNFLLEERFNHFPNLRFVVLNDNESYDEREPIARPLGPRQPGISLRLRLSNQVRPSDALAVLGQQPQLAAMVTHATTFGGVCGFEEVWALVSALPRLSVLKLSWHRDFGDDNLRRLATLPALRHLSLAICKPFTGEGLAALMGPDSPIESLAILYSKLEGTNLVHIAGSPRLHTLALAGSPGVQADHLVHLGSCPSIKRFMFQKASQINAMHLASLVTQLPSLEWLDLSHCIGMDEEALLALAPLRQLRYLNLIGCAQVSEEAVHQLAASLPALTEVAAQRLVRTSAQDLGPLRNAQGQPVTVTEQPRKL